MTDTYHKPPHGWTCFHCGETFTTVGGAEDHFGKYPSATPGCMIKLGAERGLLMALRKAEEEVETLSRLLADESCQAFRILHNTISRHKDALETAEEAGYERGLRAKRHE